MVTIVTTRKKAKRQTKNKDIKKVCFYIEEHIWNKFKSLVASKGLKIKEVLEQEIREWIKQGDKHES